MTSEMILRLRVVSLPSLASVRFGDIKVGGVLVIARERDVQEVLLTFRSAPAAREGWLVRFVVVRFRAGSS